MRSSTCAGGGAPARINRGKLREVISKTQGTRADLGHFQWLAVEYDQRRRAALARDTRAALGVELREIVYEALRRMPTKVGEVGGDAHLDSVAERVLRQDVEA